MDASTSRENVMENRKEEPFTIPLYRGWNVRFSERPSAPRIERRRENRPVARERRRAA